MSSSELPLPSWCQQRPEATIKLSPSDFQVSEILGFELSGEGEHLWLEIEKTGWNTADVARHLQKLLEVDHRDISWSGLKDKHAQTRQWFSVHLPGREVELESLEAEGLQLLKQQRHNKKLRNGSHRANHFKVCLRASDDVWSGSIEQAIKNLKTQGFANYFGTQRFGYNDNLHQAEKALLSARRGKRLSHHRRGLYLSAVRSALFNEVLTQRLGDGLWQELIEGDVLMLDGSHSVFVAEHVEPELLVRLQQQDLHISAPLFGDGESMAQAEALAREQAVWKDNQHWLPVFERFRLKPGRRAMRARVFDLQYSIEGNNLWVEVTLPAGSYCTVLLQHLARIKDASLLAESDTKS